MGICKNMVCNNLTSLALLKNCVVVLGNLRVVLMEKTNSSDFENVTFPNLREVTGFMVVYRVMGLETLGVLFPNLARIRGTQLIDNYGLIVHDMPDLREIGLYGLLKIDRGGVIIWGGPHTCFMLTVDWKIIAPRSRHVLTPPNRDTHCNLPCSCTVNASTNNCWNNKKCQRSIEGPDREICNDQCLGCKKTRPDECSVCRYYTHRGKCVSRCPDDTIILPDNKYCLTEKECDHLQGWSWNNTCTFECPIDFIMKNNSGNVTCVPCLNCQKTCLSRTIQTLNAIQQTSHCVYINGFLKIHVRAVPEAMEELRMYLGRIQEVTDYIIIYGSISITSIDFLPSLRYIGGRNLIDGTYSLVIRDMLNLQALFTPNVTKHLKIGRGKLKMYGNPVLCMSKITEIRNLFSNSSNEIDIPVGMNGYSGGCAEASVGLRVKVLNETAATVMFSPIVDPNIHYTILYIRLPPGTHTTFVPETCSESEWFAVSSPANHGIVELTSLRPATTYAVCVETYSYSYEPAYSHLARSTIVNFTTHIGKPAPPFILELVASSNESVVLRWVDHKDYHPYITRYELDVTLIEIPAKDLTVRDHCNTREDYTEEMDFSRHVVLLRPPPEYNRGCESMCGVLSTVTKGAMVEDHFDVCSSLDRDCDKHEDIRPTNSTFEKYVKSLALDLKGPRDAFQVGNLAPFRDYKFKLRACVKSKCSRSTRGVVRTFRSPTADIPTITYSYFDEKGQIAVKWEPPDTTNGPLLAYSVQVLPYLKNYGSRILPQSWCVSHDRLSLIVRSQVAPKYLVRVCATTLGSVSVCCEWNKVYVPQNFFSVLGKNLVWIGALYVFSLLLVPAIIGFLYNWRRVHTDTVSLIDGTSGFRNESDPMNDIMLTDIVPLYTVPLRDTNLD